MSDFDLNRINRRHAQFVALMPPFPGWQSPLYEDWLDLYLKLCKVAVSIDRFEREAAREAQEVKPAPERPPAEAPLPSPLVAKEVIGHSRRSGEPESASPDNATPPATLSEPAAGRAEDERDIVIARERLAEVAAGHVVVMPAPKTESLRTRGVDAVTAYAKRAAEILKIMGGRRMRYGEIAKAVSFPVGHVGITLGRMVELGEVKRFDVGIYGAPDAPAPDLPMVGGTRRVDDDVNVKITAALREGKSTRDVAALTGAAKNTVQLRRDALVAAGELKPREEMDGRDLSPHRAPVPVPLNVGAEATLTSTEKSVLAIITGDYRQGRQPTWTELAKRAEVRLGGLGAILAALELKRLIVRDLHGTRPYGEPPLPGHSADRVIEHEAAPAPPKPTEAELVQEHLRTKGVSRASEESPCLDDIIEEFKRQGTKVNPKPDHGGYMAGGKRLMRDQLLAQANRFRIMRGAPVWDSRRVRWPREDGTTQPLPAQAAQ